MKLATGITGEGIVLWIGDAERPKLAASLAADQVAPRRHYVYAHCDESGSPFYIGKGTDRRAWDGSRHPLWHRYVERHLHGKYSVQILMDDLTSENAEELESEWITQEGGRLVNWINFGRQTDFEALEKYHCLRDENRRLIATTRVKEKAEPEAAVQDYDQAIANIGGYAKLMTESGLVGQLLQEERQEAGYSGELEALDRLTLCLVRLGRGAEALSAAESYFAEYRADSSLRLAGVIKKRVGNGVR